MKLAFKNISMIACVATTLAMSLTLTSCSSKKKGMTGASGTLDSTYTDSRKGGVGLGLLDRIYFDFDRSELTSDAKETLQKNAEAMKGSAKMRVLVEGHCDERGTNEYNIALGERRARTALDYMVANGISRSRLEVKSWGEERPLDDGRDDSAYARNRRGEFVILEK